MTIITADSTLEAVAAAVTAALQGVGIQATLSGGGAVSAYTDNEYESVDLDFITSERLKAIEVAIAALGFERASANSREFSHPLIGWYVEFPPGPVAFGRTQAADDDVAFLDTEYGPIRIITPTQCVMDRLAWYFHNADNQALDQAVMVAARRDVDWNAVRMWAQVEGIDPPDIDRVQALVAAKSAEA